MSKCYIKRVIGLAGDRVRSIDGEVFVNGARLLEAYVPEDYRDARSYPETVVPRRQLTSFWATIATSRTTAATSVRSKNFIYGKAVFGYWPLDKLGKLR